MSEPLDDLVGRRVPFKVGGEVVGEAVITSAGQESGVVTFGVRFPDLAQRTMGIVYDAEHPTGGKTMGGRPVEVDVTGIAGELRIGQPEEAE